MARLIRRRCGVASRVSCRRTARCSKRRCGRVTCCVARLIRGGRGMRCSKRRRRTMRRVIVRRVLCYSRAGR